jgi:hypothetical protein
MAQILAGPALAARGLETGQPAVSWKKLKNRWRIRSGISHCTAGGGGRGGPARDTARSVLENSSGSTRAREIAMRRFLNKLLRDFRTTNSARGLRRAPRRATLQVEGLEDRLVMTSATQLGSPVLTNAISASSSVALTKPMVQVTTLKASTTEQPATSVSIYIGQPGDIDIRSDGAGHMDVVDPAVGLNAQFLIASVRSFSIFMRDTSSNLSVLHIDDSNGMPFAPGTTVDLNGTVGNVLSLEGSRTVSGNETYVAGGVLTTPGTIFLDNITFTLHSGLGVVYDYIPITGTLDVQTSGTDVQLISYYPGGQQYLSGMGFGGGDLLGFSNKPAVTLDTYATNASIFLDGADAAVGESYFTVNMHAANETTTLDQTPKNVTTVVNVDPPATDASVAVWGNFGPVIIDGDSSTVVNIGYPLASTKIITSGIEADVTVEDAASLVVNNSGNTSTFETVKVTEQTISGSGLFGNSDVTLRYGGLKVVDILAGQLADGYTVAPSSPNAVFTSHITINSESYWAFHVNVNVNSASHLKLTLDNLHRNLGVLDVTSNGGFVDLPGTHPNGRIDVFFAGQATSQIFYNGFADVS